MFTPSEGKLVAERYLLAREIGRGGMGQVWQAYDQQLGAPCALKFILQAFASHPDLRARFVREAKAIASIQSPHLVSIRGVGECEDSLYIAMELLEGETLQDRLDRDGPLGGPLTAALVDQVASVLNKAHALGIVHRDLKPDNIWLWGDGPFFVKVLDFGVAKHVQEQSVVRTATGMLVGTPHYMSPEQAEGAKSVDQRTDVWALAVIAVECLTGKRPFDGNSLAELLVKVARTKPPKLTDLAPSYARLEPWWQRATARLELRYSSVRELAEQFRAGLESAEPQAFAPDAPRTAALQQAAQLEHTAALHGAPAVHQARALAGTAPFNSAAPLTNQAAPQETTSFGHSNSVLKPANSAAREAAPGSEPPSSGNSNWVAAALGGAGVLALLGGAYFFFGSPATLPPSGEAAASSPPATQPTVAAPALDRVVSGPAKAHALESATPRANRSSDGLSAASAQVSATSKPKAVTAEKPPAPVPVERSEQKRPNTDAPKPVKTAPSPRAPRDVDERLGF